ncbi:MAG TPA: hypothetical protein VGV61_04645 [Thermoanaerobaculia bacterium]|jgi:hypothetical protein|nr:hypothetical protein [Thermoanaerobaculia bacterium]
MPKSDLVLNPAAPGAAPTAGAASRPAAASQDAASQRAANLLWQWRREATGDDRSAAARAARRRGAIGGLVGLALAATLFFWKPGMALVVAAVALSMALLALLSPLGGFRAVTRALDTFGRFVGVTITWVLMTLAYFLLFVPCGLLLRAGGKLRISRRADPRLASYWTPAAPLRAGLDGYRKPF